MRMPNRAIQRERHPSPTVDDLINAMNGATVFLKFLAEEVDISPLLRLTKV